MPSHRRADAGKRPHGSTPPPLAPRARMPTDAPRVSLLEEIDARQSELLDELDRLNGQIEQVIGQWAAWRGTEEVEKQQAA